MKVYAVVRGIIHFLLCEIATLLLIVAVCISTPCLSALIFLWPPTIFGMITVFLSVLSWSLWAVTAHYRTEMQSTPSAASAQGVRSAYKAPERTTEENNP